MSEKGANIAQSKRSSYSSASSKERNSERDDTLDVDGYYEDTNRGGVSDIEDFDEAAALTQVAAHYEEENRVGTTFPQSKKASAAVANPTTYLESSKRGSRHGTMTLNQQLEMQRKLQKEPESPAPPLTGQGRGRGRGRGARHAGRQQEQQVQPELKDAQEPEFTQLVRTRGRTITSQKQSEEGLETQRQVQAEELKIEDEREDERDDESEFVANGYSEIIDASYDPENINSPQSEVSEQKDIGSFLSKPYSQPYTQDASTDAATAYEAASKVSSAFSIYPCTESLEEKPKAVNISKKQSLVQAKTYKPKDDQKSIDSEDEIRNWSMQKRERVESHSEPPSKKKLRVEPTPSSKNIGETYDTTPPENRTVSLLEREALAQGGKRKAPVIRTPVTPESEEEHEETCEGSDEEDGSDLMNALLAELVKMVKKRGEKKRSKYFLVNTRK